MPVSRPTFRLLGVCLVSILLSACDQPSASDGERFQLTQDSRGRTIRLDKVTGETAILEGDRFVPVVTGKGSSASGSVRPRSAPATSSDAASSRTSVQPQSEAGHSPIQIAKAGDVLRLAADTPLFVSSARNLQPIATKRAGDAVDSSAPIHEGEDEMIINGMIEAWPLDDARHFKFLQRLAAS